MALTVEQWAQADAAIASAISDPLAALGVRLTPSAVSRGPLSKGELNLYSPGGTYSPPAIDNINRTPTQTRTIQVVGILSLKDLRSTEQARDLAEQVLALLEGVAPFGVQPWRLYQGRLYPRSLQLSRENQPDFERRQSANPQAGRGTDGRRWVYTLLLECQIDNPLPPYGDQ